MGNVSAASVAELDGISYSYGDLAVLDDVSVVLHKGVTGLVGVNGAGKTTLFNILAGIVPPKLGSANLFAESGAVAIGKERKSAIGVMPQLFVPPTRMTAEEFLIYIAWLKGIAKRERSASVHDVLDRVDLLGKRNARVTALSGGMQRRLLLAQALLGSPRLLLLDEPTAGLDPEQRVKQRSVLTSAADGTNAIVVSSHLIEDLVQICDRILVLDDQRIVFDGSPDDLLKLGSGLVAHDSGLSPYEAAFLRVCRGDR